MTVELGHFALVLALAVSMVLGILPLVGARCGIHGWITVAKPAAWAQFVLVAIAYWTLTAAFLNNDFSVAYVANHSNSQLPLIYQISGVWGGHEGSLLLWLLILSAWTLAVSLFCRAIPDLISARVLAVLGLISTGFLLFTLFTSNPFTRLIPAPAEGNDLNPLLQDIGLAVHPPMLYLGYVGFAVPFAFAVAALISGRFDAAWARWSRPWTNIAWMFLTIGIALGSWWAYYELGWGGWWFWDPVENASFMPWLAGTALLHSLAATEKRGVFKAWTILLAVLAFSLSLLGTFLVRSGVLVSVHSFASDPARGVFILMFLGVVIGGSLLLYAWRAPAMVSRVSFAAVSRETGLLLNNIIFGVLCFAVLLGTLYPLALDSLGLGKISVGPPYFDFVFAIIGFPLLLAAGAGALLRWKRDRPGRISRSIAVTFGLALLAALCLPLAMPHYAPTSVPGLCGGIFLILLSLEVLRRRLVGGPWWRRLTTTPGGVYGMLFGHIGMGVFVIGVTLTHVYSVEKDVRLAPGQSYAIHNYEFLFRRVAPVPGPNYQALRGEFTVAADGVPVAVLYPEKRTYLVQKNPMTEAAIDPGLTRDLYVALGEPVGTEAWAVRLYYKPFIRWIWLGALLIAAGGLFGALDRRYRQARAVVAIAAPKPDLAEARS